MTYIEAIIDAAKRGREDAASTAQYDVDDATITRFAEGYADQQMRRIYLEAFVGALLHKPSVAIFDADGGAWVLSEDDLKTVTGSITPTVARFYVAAPAKAEAQ
jgi:hypothetical protein